MNAIDRRDTLLRNIARLRRVEQGLPPSQDLVAVRASMEDELGETVALRSAARLLGFSHTALRRWIDSGDVPVVFDPSGRQRIPVEALLDLYEQVEDARRRGVRRAHLLEWVLSQARNRAERLDVRSLIQIDGDELEPHRRTELRSLAYHRALAQRLRRPMVEDALRQIWKWRVQGAIDSRYADRWEKILNGSIADVRRVISEDDPSAHALRQTSPFAGMLSEPERRKILQEIS